MRFNANAREIYRDAEEIYQCAQVARRNKEYAYIMRLAGFFLTENQAPEAGEIHLCKYLKMSVPGRPKLHLRRFGISQM
jgi:hypothetical protein